MGLFASKFVLFGSLSRKLKATSTKRLDWTDGAQFGASVIKILVETSRYFLVVMQGTGISILEAMSFLLAHAYFGGVRPRPQRVPLECTTIRARVAYKHYRTIT